MCVCVMGTKKIHFFFSFSCLVWFGLVYRSGCSVVSVYSVFAVWCVGLCLCRFVFGMLVCVGYGCVGLSVCVGLSRLACPCLVCVCVLLWVYSGGEGFIGGFGDT